MNTYKAFWKNKTLEVQSDTSYGAQQRAAKLPRVKPNKTYEVTVVLCEKDNMPVTHKGMD